MLKCGLLSKESGKREKKTQPQNAILQADLFVRLSLCNIYASLYCFECKERLIFTCARDFPHLDLHDQTKKPFGFVHDPWHLNDACVFFFSCVSLFYFGIIRFIFSVHLFGFWPRQTSNHNVLKHITLFSAITLNKCIRESQIEYFSLQRNFYLLFLKHIAHPVIIIIIAWTVCSRCPQNVFDFLGSGSSVHLVTRDTTIYVVHICEWILLAYCGYLAKKLFAKSVAVL